MTKQIMIRGMLSVTLLTTSLVVCAFSAADADLVKESYPTLTVDALASARLTDMPSGVVLQSGEMKITQKDLDAEIGKASQEVRLQLKRNLFFVLENKATQMILDYEAESWAKQNKTKANGQDDMVNKYLSSLTANLSVSEVEIKGFFDKNRDMIGDATFDQVKDQLKDYLLNLKKQEATDKHIAAIGTSYEIDINKTWAAKQYAAAMDNPIDKARKSGKPTMVDLGADGCRPCEMMTPILESLKKEYADRVNVLFVHVRKEQILAARYGVQSIPVQVFFDKDGREVFRHVGFYPKDQIVAKLAGMGVK
jgi:thiol-disulfide isomerase/thioredoxin